MAEENEMSLVEHLTELRKRMIYSFIALSIGFGICFYFSAEIYQFLATPLADALADRGMADRRMIFTSLTEPFFTYMRLGFWGGLVLSFPFIATQVWMYIAPGLYRDEKRAFLPFLIFTPVLFILGAAMAYYVLFPLAWKFFLSFETLAGDQLNIQLEAKVNEYMGLVTSLVFAFGMCFQLPVLLTLLAKVGIVTSRGLAARRKYALVIILAVAAIVTPPDLISQILLAIPIMVLYEISIVLTRMVERKRERNVGH